VEDLAQETMLAALAALNQSAEELQDLPSYVLGIARRKLADLIRNGYRRPTVPLIVRSDETVQAAILKVTAEHRLVEEERVSRLTDAMALLTSQERRVIALRYGDGLTNADVAARVGLPPDESSRVKYRALERLRKLLEKGVRS
jgi:RNA polymerase sigma factor (sigma-70 family)